MKDIESFTPLPSIALATVLPEILCSLTIIKSIELKQLASEKRKKMRQSLIGKNVFSKILLQLISHSFGAGNVDKNWFAFSLYGHNDCQLVMTMSE